MDVFPGFEDSHDFSIQSHIPSRQPSNPQTSSRVLLEFSFAFFLHNIHFLPLSVSSSQSTPLSPGLHLLILLIRQASKQKRNQRRLHRMPRRPLMFLPILLSLCSFGQLPVCSLVNLQWGSFVPSVFLEAVRAHLHVLAARPYIYSPVNTHSSSLSGQLIMDFDYSHFVLVSAAPSPTGGPAERPAPLIVSVSGLIEPNGNGCCQSSLFSSVYIPIHKRDIHYGLTENSSRHVHKHTHALTFAVY